MDHILCKNKATDNLLAIWQNEISNSISLLSKELSEIENKWKQQILDNVNQVEAEALSKARKGCLINGFFHLLLSLLLGGHVIGAGDGVYDIATVKNQASIIRRILEENDLKTAIKKLRSDGFDIQISEKFINELENKEYAIQYLHSFVPVISETQETLLKHPDLKANFADKYYSYQGSSEDSKSMFQAFIKAVRTIGIQEIELSSKLDRYISDGNYLRISHKTLIQNWMQEYEEIIKHASDSGGACS